MSEKNFWHSWAKPALSGWDPQRVETAAKDGFPDVNHRCGELELKWIERWPPRGGIVRLDHYTPHQRVWHKRRSHAGGRVHVLLGVGSKEALLFEGGTAADHLGRVPREVLMDLCVEHWSSKKEMIGGLKDAIIRVVAW